MLAVRGWEDGPCPLGHSQMEPVPLAEVLVTGMALAFLPRSLESALGEVGGENLSPSFPPFAFFIHHQIFFEFYLFIESGPEIRGLAITKVLR